jgi:hypothetical protein
LIEDVYTEELFIAEGQQYEIFEQETVNVCAEVPTVAVLQAVGLTKGSDAVCGDNKKYVMQPKTESATPSAFLIDWPSSIPSDTPTITTEVEVNLPSFPSSMMSSKSKHGKMSSKPKHGKKSSHSKSKNLYPPTMYRSKKGSRTPMSSSSTIKNPSNMYPSTKYKTKGSKAVCGDNENDVMQQNTESSMPSGVPSEWPSTIPSDSPTGTTEAIIKSSSYTSMMSSKSKCGQTPLYAKSKSSYPSATYPSKQHSPTPMPPSSNVYNPPKAYPMMNYNPTTSS